MKNKLALLIPVIAIIALAAVFSFSGKHENIIITKLKVGDKAPEISLADPNGNIIALSSLKGNIVLIDFWASWCSPCRKENPNLVRTYDKFHSARYKNAKKFEIYSVSLDDDSKKWTDAVKKDKLNWPVQVSDLMGWLSPAASTYGVESIPSNFLIDQNGTIIAINLRGKDLDDALKGLQ